MAELQWRGKALAQPTAVQSQGTQARLMTRETQSALDPGSELAETGWQNRLIQGERLEVLAALLPEFAGRVNLIYIDPPFMTGRDFKQGGQLAYSDRWQGNLDAYLQWLATTLHLLYQLLAEDGSLYVHLDWRVTHYARVILDEIFASPQSGRAGVGAGFQNEIIWHYQSGGRGSRRYARKHDTILFYTKSAHYCFHSERIGERRGEHKRNHMRRHLDEQGQVSWSIRAQGRTYTYASDSLMTPSDVWSDISHLHQRDPERNGYATQKPAALLERILLASSEPEHLVLDCFCGSGVMPAVAEQLGRRWIASDQGELAISSTRVRLLALPRRVPFIVQTCLFHTMF
jgi:site-specific DNA-methyltransferase (adenine-specific)/adenine-specific DNA-methyltransferase